MAGSARMMTFMDQSLIAHHGHAVEKVRRSSFYWALRILPRAQREAMFEIYAFCRDVDDIADESGPRDVRQGQLQQWRDEIDDIYAGRTSAHGGLAAAIRQFGLRRDDFLAVIDGMAMDVAADIRAPDWTTLDLYCDRVACAVGRLSVRVFGMEEAAGVALAKHLGRALQLTNILRDIDEDAKIGRLYLPHEALEAAGIRTAAPLQAISHKSIGAACALVAGEARKHFEQASVIMKRAPRRVVRTPRLMAAGYLKILDRLEARGWVAPRGPVRIGRVRILALLFWHGLV
jgi:presqualene diphosphate synthase